MIEKNKRSKRRDKRKIIEQNQKRRITQKRKKENETQQNNCYCHCNQYNIIHSINHLSYPGMDSGCFLQITTAGAMGTTPTVSHFGRTS
jgi:hypothetical protein